MRSGLPAVVGSGAGLVGGALAAGGRACQHCPAKSLHPGVVGERRSDRESCLQLHPGQQGRGRPVSNPAQGSLSMATIEKRMRNGHQPAAQDPGPRRATAPTPGAAKLRGCPAGGDQPTRRARLGGRPERPRAGVGDGAEGLPASRQGHGRSRGAGMLAQSPCRRVPLPKVEREEMRFLTPTRSIRATAPWSWSAPTVACASGSWPGYAGAASTWTPSCSRRRRVARCG